LHAVQRKKRFQAKILHQLFKGKLMDDQEQFANAVREAGKAIYKAEAALGRADADEKKIVAMTMVKAELNAGAKTNAAQIRAADEDITVYQARCDRGTAKGLLALAKTELIAAEMEFKQWQSNMANQRLEKHRIYNS
jgi:hypothetical protein